MKNIYILIGVIAVVINSLFGIIFKTYEVFNWITCDAVIIINVVILQLLSHSRISDGFKVSITFIFTLLGIITFFISIKLENKLENNLNLAVVIFLLAIQIILLTITKLLKSNK